MHAILRLGLSRWFLHQNGRRKQGGMIRGNAQVNLALACARRRRGSLVTRAETVYVTPVPATPKLIGEPPHADSAVAPTAWPRRSVAHNDRQPARRQIRNPARPTPDKFAPAPR